MAIGRCTPPGRLQPRRPGNANEPRAPRNSNIKPRFSVVATPGVPGGTCRGTRRSGRGAGGSSKEPQHHQQTTRRFSSTERLWSLDPPKWPPITGRWAIRRKMSPWLKTEDTEPARNKRTRARRQTTRTTTTRQQKRASGLASRWPRSPPTLARSNKLGTLTQPTPRDTTKPPQPDSAQHQHLTHKSKKQYQPPKPAIRQQRPPGTTEAPLRPL